MASGKAVCYQLKTVTQYSPPPPLQCAFSTGRGSGGDWSLEAASPSFPLDETIFPQRRSLSDGESPSPPLPFALIHRPMAKSIKHMAGGGVVHLISPPHTCPTLLFCSPTCSPPKATHRPAGSPHAKRWRDFCTPMRYVITGGGAPWGMWRDFCRGRAGEVETAKMIDGKQNLSVLTRSCSGKRPSPHPGSVCNLQGAGACGEIQ